MTQEAKALYADVCWLKQKLEILYNSSALLDRDEVLKAIWEIETTIEKYRQSLVK